MAAGRRRVGTGETVVAIGLAVGIGVDELRDLVATEEMDHAIHDRHPERMMEPGRNPPPREPTGLAIGPRIDWLGPPDIPLHRADDDIPIGKKVVIAAEHERLPGVIDRQLEGVDGPWHLLAADDVRANRLRPLWRAAVEETFQRMGVDGADDALERAILHHRHVEHPHPVDGVEETDLGPPADESLVGKLPHRQGRKGCRVRQRQLGAPRAQTAEKAVARIGETEELALPGDGVGERVGIEADVDSTPELDADPANDRLPEGVEDAGLHRTEDGVVPAAIAPGLLVLVPPVAEGAAVEAGILGEERRRGADGAEPPRLLGVEVVLPVAVDRQLPIGKRLGRERRPIGFEGRRNGGMGGGHHRGNGGRRQVRMPAQIGEEADEIAPVARMERLHQPVGHHAAGLLDDLDVGFG